MDAGTRLPEGALEVLSCGASEVVVGLETLQAFSDLQSIADVVGPSPGGVQPRPPAGQPDRFIQPCRTPEVPAPIP